MIIKRNVIKIPKLNFLSFLLRKNTLYIVNKDKANPNNIEQTISHKFTLSIGMKHPNRNEIKDKKKIFRILDKILLLKIDFFLESSNLLFIISKSSQLILQNMKNEFMINIININ